MKTKKQEEKKKEFTKRKKYGKENLIQALEAVKNGMSKKLASNTFNVPRGTIQSRLRNDLKDLPGPSPVLTSDEEDILVKWVNECCRKGFPRRRIDLQLSVANFVKKSGRHNPFKNGVPGKKWYSLFLKRHPQLTERTPEPVTAASAAVSEQNIKGWFTKIEEYLKDNQYFSILNDPTRVFNGDESNFQLCPKSGKVLAIKGDKDVYEVDNAPAKSSLTVLFTFGANGDVTPPLVVFPNKRLPKELTSKVPGDWGIGLSDTGWMKAELFYDYIKNVFHPYLKKTKRNFPVILFVDGHKTHLTIEISELCRSLDIILIALYPNATRLLQPADVAAFRPLKIAWKESVLRWRRDNPLETFTKNDFVPVLKEALNKGIKNSTIVNGFRVTGLCPWNWNAIDFKKCLGETPASSKDHVSQKVLTAETFFNLIGDGKKTSLLATSEESLFGADKILKQICMYFSSDTSYDLKQSEKATQNTMECLPENVDIRNLPIEFIDDMNDHVEVVHQVEIHNIPEQSDRTNADYQPVSINEENILIENESEILCLSQVIDDLRVPQLKGNIIEPTSIKIQDVLPKQKTPQRKVVRNIQRPSFVLTSNEWFKKEFEKCNEKKLKEEQIKKRKQDRIQKQEENKKKNKREVKTSVKAKNSKNENSIKEEKIKFPPEKQITVLSDVTINIPLEKNIEIKEDNKFEVVARDSQSEAETERHFLDKIIENKKKSYTIEELEKILADE